MMYARKVNLEVDQTHNIRNNYLLNDPQVNKPQTAISPVAVATIWAHKLIIVKFTKTQGHKETDEYFDIHIG